MSPVRLIDAIRVSCWLFCAFLTAAFSMAPARAQGQSLAAPVDRTVPSFSVLDSSPMSIEHVDPLHSTLLTLFSTLRKDDLLPRDIAVEILPWLIPGGGRQATLDEQFERLRNPPAAAVRQYLAVSLAISQDVSPAEGDESLSHVSLSVRTFLKRGSLRRSLIELMDDYKEATSKILDTQGAQPDNRQNQDSDTLAKLFLEVRRLVQSISEADKNRVGFMLEAGVAQVLEVPQHTISDARGARSALWGSPIFRMDSKPLDFAGLFRFIDERSTSSQIFDFGGRIVARRAGVQYSMEAVGRRRFVEEILPGDDLWNARWVGGITYGFNRSTNLNFTFGKNYKNDFARAGSLLASFGMTIGLGEVPLGIMPDSR